MGALQRSRSIRRPHRLQRRRHREQLRGGGDGCGDVGFSGAVTSNLVASASTAGVSSLTGAVTANRVASGTVAGVSGVRGEGPAAARHRAVGHLGDSTTYRSGTTSSPRPASPSPAPCSRPSASTTPRATGMASVGSGCWSPTRAEDDSDEHHGRTDGARSGRRVGDRARHERRQPLDDFETAVNTRSWTTWRSGRRVRAVGQPGVLQRGEHQRRHLQPRTGDGGAARPSEMRVLDFNTYIHGGGVYDAADWIYLTDSTHMTVQGVGEARRLYQGGGAGADPPLRGGGHQRQRCRASRAT